MKKITAKDYLKVIEWSDEDHCFIGSAPPLIGHCCHGKTEVEVMKQLNVIIQEWIDIYHDDGRELPHPNTGKYSGKFILRTGEELHRFLAIAAFHAGESLNNFVIKKLQPSYERASKLRQGIASPAKKSRKYVAG